MPDNYAEHIVFIVILTTHIYKRTSFISIFGEFKSLDAIPNGVLRFNIIPMPLRFCIVVYAGAEKVQKRLRACYPFREAKRS